jgi:hypothetical protein
MLGEHVIQRQGLITEQGYEEQPQSYRNMGAFAKSALQAAPAMVDCRRAGRCRRSM